MTTYQRDDAPSPIVPSGSARSSGLHERPPFLATHRAISACTREFAALIKELIAGVTTLAAHAHAGKPVVRQSPDRCVLQVGDVALTVTWLRNGSDYPQHGQLLGIIWRGVVAPRAQYSAERVNARSLNATPVAEWEESLVATASCPDSWRWARDTMSDGLTSVQLAAQLTERLRMAYPHHAPLMEDAAIA